MRNHWIINSDVTFLNRFRDEALTINCFDMETALGDTLKEKYESLYIKLVETSKEIEGLSGLYPNWMVTTPEIASIFETSSSWWQPTLLERRPVEYVMVINQKWRLYKTDHLDEDEIVLGFNPLNKTVPFHGNTSLNAEHYGILTVDNLKI